MNYLLDTNEIIHHDNWGDFPKKVFISAITIMEILKNLDSDNFVERKKTAQKIINSNINILWADSLYLMYCRDLKIKQRLNYNEYLRSLFKALISANSIRDVEDIDDYKSLNDVCESYDRFIQTIVYSSKFMTRVVKGKDQLYSVSNLDNLSNRIEELSKELYINLIKEVMKDREKYYSYKYLRNMYHNSKSKKFFIAISNYCVNKIDINGFENIVEDTTDLYNHIGVESQNNSSHLKRFVKNRHVISRNDGTDLVQILYLKDNFTFVSNDLKIKPYFTEVGIKVDTYDVFIKKVTKKF